MQKYQWLPLVLTLLAPPVMCQELLAIIPEGPVKSDCSIMYNDMVLPGNPNCRKVLTEDGAKSLEKRVLDRNAADRKVLLDLISTLDQRIKTIEEHVAPSASSSLPNSTRPSEAKAVAAAN